MPKDTVARYLERHAEPLAHTVPQLLRRGRNVICIPACDEGLRFEETLKSIADLDGAEGAVLVLVINGAEDAAESIHKQNAELLSWARDLLGTGEDAISVTEWGGFQVVLVDCASPGRRLPAKQGVGLARKLAGDIAVVLHRRGDVDSAWMACTDADVQLPPEYLTSLPDNNADFSAALFPFEHTLEGSVEQQKAMLQYECFLHYYVLGLQAAESPYAYHSIGSSFAVRMDRYAAVHGFPKKLAAEDFYLLNKLVKQAPLLRLNCAPIRIQGRESMRVPFGTGRAVRDIQKDPGPYRVYHPDVFAGIATWQRAQIAFSNNPSAIDWDSVLNDGSLPDGLLRSCLERQGALNAAQKAAQQASSTHLLRRRLFEWNDAFRTLRLIHELRDSGIASVPLIDALQHAQLIGEGSALDAACRILSKRVHPTELTPVGLLQI